MRFNRLAPGPGRPPGSRNRLSRLARENIERVFNQLGGIEAMVAWAQVNQTEFYTRVYPRLLVMEASIASEYLDPTRRTENMTIEEILSTVLALHASADPAMRAELDRLMTMETEWLKAVTDTEKLT